MDSCIVCILTHLSIRFSLREPHKFAWWKHCYFGFRFDFECHLVSRVLWQTQHLRFGLKFGHELPGIFIFKNSYRWSLIGVPFDPSARSTEITGRAKGVQRAKGRIAGAIPLPTVSWVNDLECKREREIQWQKFLQEPIWQLPQLTSSVMALD